MPDYFIKTGGNDGLDGKSDANAWATWGKVVTHFSSAANTAPGDNYYFRRGDSFSASSALILNEDGLAGSPITIGAYGTASSPLPVINASAIVGGLIYNGFDWFVIQDLNLNGPGKSLTASANSGISFDTTAASCQILRCEIRNFNNIGITSNGDFCRIAENYIHDIGAHGIVAGDPGDQLEVANNRVTAWGGNSTWEAGGRHGIYLESKNGRVWGNEFYSPDAGVSGQGISVRKSTLRVFGNVIHDMPSGMGWFNYDPISVSNLTPGFAWIYGNIMYNLANYAFYIDGSPPAARVGGPGTFQNTVDLAFVNNYCHFSGGGAADYAISMDIAAPNIDASTRIINNIITGTPGKYLKLANPTRAGKSLVEKKNLFFGATQANPFRFSAAQNDYANLAAYQAGSSQGTGDINSDPGLVSISYPEPLLQSSPVVDVGATDGETGGLVYANNPAFFGPHATGWSYRGALPDIGAIGLYHAPVSRPNSRAMPPNRIG